MKSWDWTDALVTLFGLAVLAVFMTAILLGFSEARHNGRLTQQRWLECVHAGQDPASCTQAIYGGR